MLDARLSKIVDELAVLKWEKRRTLVAGADWIGPEPGGFA
jgi:hypothetical protein